MSSRSPSRSAQEWSELIAQVRAGHETDAEFCQRLKLNFHTFRKHKYANSKTRSPKAKFTSAFQEVRLSPMLPSGTITVHASEDVRLDLPVSMDMNAVAQLVRALQHER